MAFVAAFLPVLLIALVVVPVVRTNRRPSSLCRFERYGDEIVVRVDVPWWMAYRRTLTARVSDVVGARVVPAGERPGFILRVCGLGWPGFYTGWFWRRDGFCYVVRRRRYDCLEVVLAAGRVRRWIVEVEAPVAVVADLTGSGVPSATPAVAPTTPR